MLKRIRVVLCLGVALCVSACSLLNSSPEKVFTTIGLNGNKLPSSFHRHFKEMRQHKAQGSLQIVGPDNKMKKATCGEFVEWYYKTVFDKDIEKIQKLRPSDENRAIIADGLALFKYADGIYKNDFPVIARMIDEGQPDSQVDAALVKLEETKGQELDKMRAKVMDQLLPYADKHGVKYKTIDMPGGKG